MPSPATAQRALQRLTGPALLRWLRAEVVGREQVPATGPVLLAPNHRSFLDHLLVLAAAPRPVSFLGKVELARGLSGRLNLAFGMVPVQRGTADRAALGAVLDLLAGGHAVVVFPEGTRSPTGELFRFRGGIARLAATAGAPVVPVGLRGTAVVWPRGSSRPVGRPPAGVVRVEFGAPLDAPDDSGVARRAFLAALWGRVAQLSDQRPADRLAPIEQAVTDDAAGADGPGTGVPKGGI